VVSAPVGVEYVSARPGDGYGNAALGMLAALDHLHVPVRWTPLRWGHEGLLERAHVDGPFASWVGRDVATDTLLLHVPPTAYERHLARAGDRTVVTLTTWETDRVPAAWLPWLARCDRVLVPSRFNADVFVASGVTAPVHVVPHCVHEPHPERPAFLDAVGERFAFYTIGPWGTRKGMVECVRAFLDAFSARDDVALVVKTTALDLRRDRRPVWHALAELLAGHRDPPFVLLAGETLSTAEIDGLHAAGDCFVSLTRGEGFGLNVLDAAAAGKPVLATGWSGPVEILGADHPLLVDHDLVPMDDDEPDAWLPVLPGHRWARARHDHAVELLRWVASHREDAAAIGERAGARVRHRFATESVAPRLLAALD